MNIHEYQAKELFDRFGVPNPRGGVASTPDEAAAIAADLEGSRIVVKSQIHAGGRGKGVFANGFKGGVHACGSAAEARELAAKMLNQTLVTAQTGRAGRVVRKVLVVEAASIKRELYFAILMDRATAGPVVIASTEGGVEIEKVAETHPEKIVREPVDPVAGLRAFQARKVAVALGFRGPLLSKAASLFLALYKAFAECDCSMVEINPLVETADGKVIALDGKFNFDDNALFRQPAIAAMRDRDEEDPREVAATEHGLNYISLTGDIACLVNGAGLAMATMDIIKHFGGEPANFLDVGGGASREQVTAAFKIILGDPGVRGILVNIFGGIMDCDVIANGIVAAARETALQIPLVVRLEGNNVDAGKATLAASGLPLVAADDLADAAQKIVAAVGAANAPVPTI